MTAHMHIQRTTNGYALNGLECIGLPPAQSRALLLRAQGASISATANATGCSTQNIKNTISTLFLKLGAESSPELITRAFISGHLKMLSIFFAIGITAMAHQTDTAARPLRTAQTRITRQKEALA